MVAFRSYDHSSNRLERAPAPRLALGAALQLHLLSFRLPAGLATATFSPLLSNEPLDHANARLSTVSLPGLFLCGMRC